jgi:hypothetical protein
MTEEQSNGRAQGSRQQGAKRREGIAESKKKRYFYYIYI